MIFNLALIGMARAILMGGAGCNSVDRLIHDWVARPVLP